jgi:ferredoxin
MPKVKVDPKKCIGCGLCTSIAEKSFKMNDDGKAEAIVPTGDSDAKIKEAIESCPVSAIIRE